MATVAIVTNPLSTRNRKRPDDWRALGCGKPDIAHFVLDGFTALSGILDEIAAARPDLLVINGGDGTVQAVLTGLIGRARLDPLPPVAVLAGGQTNMLAGDLGTAGRIVPEFERLAQSFAAGRLHELLVSRPLLALETAPGAPPVYGFFFGAATVVRGIEFCRRRIYPTGLPEPIAHLAAIGLLLGSAVAGEASFAMKRGGPLAVSLDGEDLAPARYFLAMATTLERLILGLKPFRPGSKGPIRYTTIRPGALSIVAALGQLAGIMRLADMPGGHGLHARDATRIELRFEGPCTLDGEFFYPEAGEPVRLSADRHVAFVGG